jgi:hypothetical protein
VSPAEGCSGTVPSSRSSEATWAVRGATPFRSAVFARFVQAAPHTVGVEVLGVDRRTGLLPPGLVQTASIDAIKAQLFDVPHRHSASLQLRIGSASTGARVSSRTGVGSGRKRIQRAIGHRKRRRLHLTACFNGENRRDRRSRERRVPSIVSHFARDALFSPHNPRGLPSRHERELRGVRPGATRP